VKAGKVEKAMEKSVDMYVGCGGVKRFDDEKNYICSLMRNMEMQMI